MKIKGTIYKKLMKLHHSHNHKNNQSHIKEILEIRKNLNKYNNYNNKIHKKLIFKFKILKKLKISKWKKIYSKINKKLI